ncbi:type IX secretion system membrane protein PorP/SprF [Pontibacter sp. SGAir0037]|uniref:PorP/SprF family type IX secretion system membrane protein n=1 Tax=Pontibacter sp. SGAir0037 TaxID=2571030 RepID=UPI0010CCFF20|nr:type IX secretion system membrane protein PorP/SprF [Pontibacter sp. SGAir0037]QCR22834.1 hypothetical protein C1N53_11095 [Pontibacter sp. SGAir0037]
MNKLLAITFFSILLISQAVAQQKPHYTQYTLNNYILNPAISGIEDYADLKLGSRHQWSGLEGAPVSYYATFHAPIMKDMLPVSQRSGGSFKKNSHRPVRPHHGIGAMVMTTKTGPLERTSLNVSYAYHVPLTRSIRLSAGVSPGLIQYTLNQDYVTLASKDVADQAVQDGRVNETKLDLNLGMWLYSQDFYIGLAGAQLAPGKRKDIANYDFTDNTGELQKQYFITGGVRLEATPDISLVPSVMVKMAQPSPLSVDANLKAIYADRFWIGASYRHKDALAAMAGINVSPLLDVSYSYDASASPLGASHSGSHEVVLGFKLRNTRKVLCPQFAW